MILVDAGVLIDYLRTKDAKLRKLFQSEPTTVCGVTRAEILAGARSVKDRRRLLRFLGSFQQVAIPERHWDIVGDALSNLYSRGISIPFPDVVMATLGIEMDVEVWARDPHFPVMQHHLPGLKLFKEPP